MTVQTTFTECERALDSGKLQVLGHRGWYDIRRNGATKRWKTRPHSASIPVKCGLHEAFRLDFNDALGGRDMALRIRPADFDPRNRSR